MEKDGKITSEEKAIFNHVIKNIDQFTDAYTKALEDNVITQDKHINLTVLWDKIYDESYKVAMKDSHLSDDETEMVFKIFDSLKQYY